MPAGLRERGGGFRGIVDDYDFATGGLEVWFTTLADDELGAIVDGLNYEAVAVVEGAFNGYEDVAGLDEARIGADVRWGFGGKHR